MRFLQQLSKSYKNIGINILALGFVQITNLLLPLITFPYLVRVIGIEKYGTVTYALTIMLYMISITEYGFGLSATREISVSRNDIIKLSEIFSSVLVTRIVLLFAVTCILIVSLGFYPRLSSEPFLYLTGLTYVLGNVLLPNWFFQGIEKMKYLTFLNILSKALTLLLIIYFVRSEPDYKYIVLIYGIANSIAGIFGLFIAAKLSNLKFYIPSKQLIINELRNGWSFFSLNLSALLFSSSTIVILGVFVNDTDLGKYSIAEKITFLVSQLLIVISQAVYPHLCQLSELSHEALVKFVRRLTIGLGISIFVICLTMCLLSNQIIYLVSGRFQPEISRTLAILSFHGFIVCFIHPVYQTLIAYKKQKYTAWLFNWMVVVNILTTTILAYLYGINGAAVAALLTQFLTVGSLYLLLEVKFKQYSLIKTKIS